MPMGDDASGPLIGWSLGSMQDGSSPRPFDTLKFPCVFRFKAIAKSDDGVVEALLGLVAGVVGHAIADDDWSVRSSGAGRYTSLTLDVHVTSGQMVYDVYEALKRDSRVTHLL